MRKILSRKKNAFTNEAPHLPGVSSAGVETVSPVVKSALQQDEERSLQKPRFVPHPLPTPSDALRREAERLRQSNGAESKDPRSDAERTTLAHDSHALSDNDKDELSALGFVAMEDVTAEAVDWLWEGRIPYGMLSVVDGRPDAGKTNVLCEIAARVTRGLLMPLESVAAVNHTPKSIVFVTSENAFAQVLRPRLEAVGADLTKCFGWSETPVKGGKGRKDSSDLPRFPRDAESLETAVRKFGAGLVVIDPIFSHLDVGLNPNSSVDVGLALTALAHIAESTGAAVVVVRHFNKAANGDSINAGVGSIGVVGTARAQLVVGQPPDSDNTDPLRVLAVSKLNVGMKAPSVGFTIVGAEVSGVSTSRVEWGSVVQTTASELTRAKESGQGRAAVAEAKEWLENQLASGSRSSKELMTEARKAGFGWRSLTRAKKHMAVKSVKQPGARGGWFWRLDSDKDMALAEPDPGLHPEVELKEPTMAAGRPSTRSAQPGKLATARTSQSMRPAPRAA